MKEVIILNISRSKSIETEKRVYVNYNVQSKMRKRKHYKNEYTDRN
jgi:hypothetical protein